MIKVKIDRPTDNIFYVEDGETVSYADNVLEVLDIDDSVIAVFRDWLYALPAIEEDEDQEPGEVEFEVPDISSYVHANNHGDHGLLDDGTAEPVE
jgi:hypothetical protein